MSKSQRHVSKLKLLFLKKTKSAEISSAEPTRAFAPAVKYEKEFADAENANLRIQIDESREEVSQLKASRIQVQNAYEAAYKRLEEEQKKLKIMQRRLKYLLEENLKQKQQTSPSKLEPDEDHSRKLSQESTDSSGSEGQAERDKHVEEHSTDKDDDVAKKLLRALNQDQFLATLKFEKIMQLVKMIRYQKIRKGERLITDGKGVNVCFLLTSGKVVSRSKEESSNVGTAVPLWTLFGSDELFYNIPALMTHECVQPGAMWYFSREDFRRVLPRSYLRKTRERCLKPFYANLEKPEVKRIASVSKFRRFKSGEIILGQETKISFVYLIHRGEVHKSRGAEGIQTFEKSLSRGSMFEISEATSPGHDPCKRSTFEFTAAGEEATTCIEIPLQVFNDFKADFKFIPALSKAREDEEMTDTTGSSGYHSLSGDDIQELYEATKPISNTDWLEFARRSLKLDDHDIDCIVTDFREDSRQRRLTMLQTWCDERCGDVTVDELQDLVQGFFRLRYIPADQDLTDSCHSRSSEVEVTVL